MMIFQSMTLPEKIKCLWPPYRRAREARTKAAIRWLVEHPEAECTIDGHYIPNGFGEVARPKYW